MMTLLPQISWDLSLPISSMQRVWDVVARRLREVRDVIRGAQEELYGKQDRLSYISSCHDGLKYLTERGAKQFSVITLADLEKVLENARQISSPRSPRQLQSAIEDIKMYINRLKSVLKKLQEAKKIFTDDLLQYLELYCANYAKLGSADDKFFKSLRHRTVSIRDHMKSFEKLVEVLDKKLPLCETYFSDCFFSQEISIVCDCDSYPLLRVVPDLIQKMELSCDTASDWLRSDKVYLEQVEKEIEDVRSHIRETENSLKMCKLEYESIFKLLKQRQIETDEYDDNVDALWKELSKMKAKKARLEIEIMAVEKTLSGTRDHLRELNNSTVEHRCYCSDSDEVDLDCTYYSGNASSSYKSRLSRDAETQTMKLESLHKKKKKLEKQIAKKRAVLKDAESKEIEVQQLSKKLRAVGRQKAKFTEELEVGNSHMSELQEVIQRRLDPGAQTKKKTSQNSSKDKSSLPPKKEKSSLPPKKEKSSVSSKREKSSVSSYKKEKSSLLPKREKLPLFPKIHVSLPTKGEKSERVEKTDKKRCAKRKPKRSEGKLKIILCN